MFEGVLGAEHGAQLTVYTDAYVVRGTIATRQRRVTDILNLAEEGFVVLTDAVLEEFGHRSHGLTAPFAQINLSAVLFAVADTPVEPSPELRTPKVSQSALISIPPFKVTGMVHLRPERDLRVALGELTGRFLPVTEAAFWSDAVGEPRTTATMVAVNHARAQIVAPYVAPNDEA